MRCVHSSEQLLHRYAVERLCEQFADNPDSVFTMELHEGAIRRLVDVLRVGNADHRPLNLEAVLPHPDLGIKPGSRASRMIVFKVVRGVKKFSSVVRSKLAGEQGLLPTDISISLSRVFEVHKEARQLTVSLSLP